MLSILKTNTNPVESTQMHLISTSLTTATWNKSILVSKHLSLLKTWLLDKENSLSNSAHC